MISTYLILDKAMVQFFFFFKLKDAGVWTVVPVVGTTPGRRYGHSLTFTKPFLIVFGGNTG